MTPKQPNPAGPGEPVAATPLNPTPREWFGGGQRVGYDPRAARIVEGLASTSVFRRVIDADERELRPWMTMLAGFPEGSFGWAPVEQAIATSKVHCPRLYVEYLGQGESDKPADYPYSTAERADLVEAHWKDLEVDATSLVTFDYSSLVALELLSRKLERHAAGEPTGPRIDAVIIINGGLFADGHSHPWWSTPLLGSPLGPIMTTMGQRFPLLFKQLLKPLFSAEYVVSDAELDAIYDVVARRDGARFVSQASRFVSEHTAHAHRWDLRRLYRATKQSASYLIIGSECDPFEPQQVDLARRRLGPEGLDTELVPGGHMAPYEQPALLTRLILQTVDECNRRQPHTTERTAQPSTETTSTKNQPAERTTP